jgi:uncharacterized protein (TIGR03435 family)
MYRIQVTFGLVLSAAFAYGQPAAPLSFEVATIKLSPPLDMAALRSGTAHLGTKIDAARVDIATTSLFRLICYAYRLKPYQVTGPDWIKNTNFDIQAKIPDGVSPERVPEMLQALLVERLGLKIHHETKDQTIYALVVAKGGPNLKEAAPETQPAPAAEPKPDDKAMTMSMPTAVGDVKLTRSAQGIGLEMPGGEISGKLRVSVVGGTPPKIHIESAATTMKNFADLLSVGVVDRPVQDMTGLTGRFDVGVDLSAEEAMNVARNTVNLMPVGPKGGDGPREGKASAEGASDPSGASIHDSLRKLGLKLEPRKLPLDLLVIDHIEKAPSAN